jgi:hypothetical protein
MIHPIWLHSKILKGGQRLKWESSRSAPDYRRNPASRASAKVAKIKRIMKENRALIRFSVG